MRRSEKSDAHRLAKSQSDKRPALDQQTSQAQAGSHDALLHDLFDGLEVGFANVLPTGEIIYANSKFAVHLGNPLHRQVNGRNLHDFISAHSKDSLDQALRQAANRSVVGELTIDSDREKTHTIRLSLSPAEVLGQPVIRIVADEVTELVEANQQLRQTEASLRALSGRILQIQDQERRRMARDLHDTTGQELAILVMSLRHLEENIGRSDVDAPKAISKAVELAQKVNDEIRTLSYLLHPPLLDQMGLGSALKWYVDGFAERSGIQVRLVLPADLCRFAPEKEVALFRVAQEGLANVLRHSGSKSAKIVVCASVDEVEIKVQDEGKGISESQIRSLSSNSGENLGVGLPGLRERIHQFGGNLEIISNREGTTLLASVPIEPTAGEILSLLDQPAEHGHGGPAHSVHSNGRKHILVVDDHEVMRRGIRGLLESYTDLEVCGEARDGTEAVRKARELDPDLIILDLNMPGMGGLAAANHLQQLESRAKVLVFTTHSFPGIERTLRGAGINGMVSKLHAERDLLRGIRAVLGGGEFFSDVEPETPKAAAARASRSRSA
jgi:signal transduction histidine kinase/AmiR/NasT family two-component response regulator